VSLPDRVKEPPTGQLSPGEEAVRRRPRAIDSDVEDARPRGTDDLDSDAAHAKRPETLERIPKARPVRTVDATSRRERRERRRRADFERGREAVGETPLGGSRLSGRRADAAEQRRSEDQRTHASIIFVSKTPSSSSQGVTQTTLPGVFTNPPPPVETVLEAAPLPAVPVFWLRMNVATAALSLFAPM
jgi:hypothetical protein